MASKKDLVGRASEGKLFSWLLTYRRQATWGKSKTMRWSVADQAARCKVCLQRARRRESGRGRVLVRPGQHDLLILNTCRLWSSMSAELVGGEVFGCNKVRSERMGSGQGFDRASGRVRGWYLVLFSSWTFPPHLAWATLSSNVDWCAGPCYTNE
jgi:hypothetical protein